MVEFTFSSSHITLDFDWWSCIFHVAYICVGFFFPLNCIVLSPVKFITYLRKLPPWLGFPGSTAIKNPPANARDAGSISGLGRCTPVFTWKIPWTEELGGLQPMGSKRVGHDLATKQQQQSVLLIRVFSPLVLLCVFLFVCWALCFFVCFFPILYHILSPSFSISPQSLCSTSFPCLKQAKDSRLQYL